MSVDRYQRLRRRIAAARSEDGAEGGFVLMYVLIVTLLVTTAVTALVMTTTAAITPTRDRLNRTTAYAAAQAGIQDAVAWMNANCPSVGTYCAAALGAAGTNMKSGNTVNVLAGSGETFSWKIGASYVQDQPTSPTYRYLRVTSIGTTNGRSVALVADIAGTPSVLDYEYYSTYETNGTADINALNPARNVYVNCSSVSAASGSLSFSCPSGSTTTASWNGYTGAVTSGNSSSAYPSPTVCDNLWYDSSTFDGTTGIGRSNTETPQGIASSAYDWRETGTANGTSVSRNVPCQVAFTSGQNFNGKVYTVDAPLISNGTPGGSGPTFSAGLYTAWQQSSVPGATAAEYRSDPAPTIGGTLASNAISRPNPLSFSSTFNPTVPTTACIYYGPTRVYLNGNGTATVTSPQTTTALQTASGSPASCYSTKNSAGQFTVTYTATSNDIIYVKNNGSTANVTTTKQKADSTPSASDTAFYLTNSTVTGTLDSASVGAPDTCSSSSTYTGSNASTNCAWSGASSSAGSSFAPDTNSGWSTYTNNTSNVNSCSTLSVTDRLRFECEFNGGSISAGHTDYYALFRQQRIQTPLSRSTITGCTSSVAPTTASAADLACFINSALQPADSGTGSTSSSRQYIVTNTSTSTTTSTQSVASSTAPTAPVSGDSFFTQQAGSGAVETVTSKAITFTIGRQAGTCNLLNLFGACIGSYVWGDGTTVGASVPQFQVTITQKSYSNLQAGSPAVSYFPSMSDVTQYGTGTGGANGSYGPGDVYVQGVNTQPLSILSDNDTIVTGNLTNSGSGATLLDALGDVRVYNPVSCKDQTTADIDATSAGFCPNDLTGLYTGGLVSGGTLSSAHPANQYVNILGTPVSTINAAIVAQGTNNSTGSFRTDNANRGSSDGTLSITGGIYQRHRGALGVQWEYLSSATGARAISGYKVSLSYNDLQSAGLNYVPTFVGGSPTRYWNVVATSSCTTTSGGTCTS